MTKTLLHVDSLCTTFGSGEQLVRAVDGVSFDIAPGETFALLGESGCGKSMTALSAMRLVPEPAGRISDGVIRLHGEDLLALPEVAMRNVRGRRIAMIFQEPMTSLNPVLTVGEQISEGLERHLALRGKQAHQRVLALLDSVGIPDPVRRYGEYPHQLSGGMKQRVMIAIALAGEPELLIADEPTTALDVTIQAQVLDLMRQLQKDTGMSILLITHDLGVVAEMADRVAVMYAGQIVEEASRERFFVDPRHPYSRKLFESLPNMGKRGQRLAVIRGSVPSLSTVFRGCRFVDRCDSAGDICREQVPVWTSLDAGQGVRCHLHDPAQQLAPNSVETSSVSTERASQRDPNDGDELLCVEGLKVHFPIHKGLLRRVNSHVRAVDDVSFDIPAGHTLALVGESGCGKTTVGKGILQLIPPTDGVVRFNGVALTGLNARELRRQRGELQIIFQDPFSSMNPRMMVTDIIEEGMITQGIGASTVERAARVDQLLEQVGLSPELKHRYPHEFSGGQRQRICIARVLAVEPKLIVCDEPTSALDVSVQAQILNLLKDLQDELGLAFLFITHDLSVVEYLAHEVAVMYLGRIVEQGCVEEVLNNPLHPYTQALLSAVPNIEAGAEGVERKVLKVAGEMPSPVNPPSGCHFHPRCPLVMDECRHEYPPLFFVKGSAKSSGSTHATRCFLYKKEGTVREINS
ncbi:MAG: ABC transporter ATP-binding protein [Gammaproteobacteria bacterium]|nr:ABC transporter ATP-binding protein [Gammaproteobacteria bacterium]